VFCGTICAISIPPTSTSDVTALIKVVLDDVPHVAEYD